MALITANRFNTLRQSVDNVLGNGAGDTGYGQTLTSATINVGDIINASHINAVYEDLRKCYKQKEEVSQEEAQKKATSHQKVKKYQRSCEKGFINKTSASKLCFYG